MAARNNTISKLSNLLLERNVNHLFKNQFRSSNKDSKSYSLKLATIWGAKGDEADITVLIRDGIDEDDIQMTLGLFMLLNQEQNIYI